MKSIPTNAESQQQPMTIEQIFQQAIIHHQAGQLQNAEHLYHAILRAHPNHSDANHNLGVIAVQIKQPANGLPYFKAALEANQSQVQYWLSYINALDQAGQIDAARHVLEQGRQRGLKGNTVDMLDRRLKNNIGVVPTKQGKLSALQKDEKPELEELKKLMTLFNQGRYKDVAILAQDITARFPLFGFGWMMLGTALKQMEQRETALLNMKKAVELSPRESRWHCDLGALYHELNRFDEAISSYRQAIGIEPNLAEAHYNLGNTFHALNRFHEAENSYKKAIEIKPEYAKAHNNIGNTLLKLGRLNEAKNSYQLALDVKPDYSEAYNNLGNVLRELGLLEEALVSCHHAINIKSDYAEAYNNQGNTLRDFDRINEAIISYRRALDIKPDFAEAHSNLGISLKDLRHLDEAEASCRRAIAIKPDFAEAHSNLGDILKDLQRLDEAEACCQRALEINPNLVEAYNCIGNIFRELGRLNDAVSNYRYALEINPNFAKGLLNLGHTLCDLDNLTQAATTYQKCLDIDPGNSGIEAAIFLSVLDYLNGDIELCQRHLIAAQEIKSKVNLKNKNSHSYWQYLNKLVSELKKTDNNNTKPLQCKDMIYVVGESHSIGANGIVVCHTGHKMLCVTKWIPGCKQWHLGNKEPNRFKIKFEETLGKLQSNSTILLTIGEIDCRHDEGILIAWKKKPETDIAEFIESNINSYVNYVHKLTFEGRHRIIICGVPCSNIPSDELIGTELNQHIDLITLFNKKLKRIALSAGMDFLDIHSLTDNGNGVPNKKWYIDSNHLLPIAYVEAFDHYYVSSL